MNYRDYIERVIFTKGKPLSERDLNELEYNLGRARIETDSVVSFDNTSKIGISGNVFSLVSKDSSKNHFNVFINGVKKSYPNISFNLSSLDARFVDGYSDGVVNLVGKTFNVYLSLDLVTISSNSTVSPFNWNLETVDILPVDVDLKDSQNNILTTISMSYYSNSIRFTEGDMPVSSGNVVNILLFSYNVGVGEGNPKFVGYDNSNPVVDIKSSRFNPLKYTDSDGKLQDLTLRQLLIESWESTTDPNSVLSFDVYDNYRVSSFELLSSAAIVKSQVQSNQLSLILYVYYQDTLVGNLSIKDVDGKTMGVIKLLLGSFDFTNYMDVRFVPVGSAEETVVYESGIGKYYSDGSVGSSVDLRNIVDVDYKSNAVNFLKGKDIVDTYKASLFSYGSQKTTFTESNVVYDNVLFTGTDIGSLSFNPINSSERGTGYVIYSQDKPSNEFTDNNLMDLGGFVQGRRFFNSLYRNFVFSCYISSTGTIDKTLLDNNVVFSNTGEVRISPSIRLEGLKIVVRFNDDNDVISLDMSNVVGNICKLMVMYNSELMEAVVVLSNSDGVVSRASIGLNSLFIDRYIWDSSNSNIVVVGGKEYINLNNVSKFNTFVGNRPGIDGEIVTPTYSGINCVTHRDGNIMTVDEDSFVSYGLRVPISSRSYLLCNSYNKPVKSIKSNDYSETLFDNGSEDRTACVQVNFGVGNSFNDMLTMSSCFVSVDSSDTDIVTGWNNTNPDSQVDVQGNLVVCVLSARASDLRFGNRAYVEVRSGDTSYFKNAVVFKTGINPDRLYFYCGDNEYPVSVIYTCYITDVNYRKFGIFTSVENNLVDDYKVVKSDSMIRCSIDSSYEPVAVDDTTSLQRYTLGLGVIPKEDILRLMGSDSFICFKLPVQNSTFLGLYTRNNNNIKNIDYVNDSVIVEFKYILDGLSVLNDGRCFIDVWVKYSSDTPFYLNTRFDASHIVVDSLNINDSADSLLGNVVNGGWGKGWNYFYDRVGNIGYRHNVGNPSVALGLTPGDISKLASLEIKNPDIYSEPVITLNNIVDVDRVGDSIVALRYTGVDKETYPIVYNSFGKRYSSYRGSDDISYIADDRQYLTNKAESSCSIDRTDSNTVHQFMHLASSRRGINLMSAYVLNRSYLSTYAGWGLYNFENIHDSLGYVVFESNVGQCISFVAHSTYNGSNHNNVSWHDLGYVYGIDTGSSFVTSMYKFLDDVLVDDSYEYSYRYSDNLPVLDGKVCNITVDGTNDLVRGKIKLVHLKTYTGSNYAVVMFMYYDYSTDRDCLRFTKIYDTGTSWSNHGEYYNDLELEYSKFSTFEYNVYNGDSVTVQGDNLRRYDLSFIPINNEMILLDAYRMDDGIILRHTFMLRLQYDPNERVPSAVFVNSFGDYVYAGHSYDFGKTQIAVHELKRTTTGYVNSGNEEVAFYTVRDGNVYKTHFGYSIKGVHCGVVSRVTSFVEDINVSYSGLHIQRLLGIESGKTFMFEKLGNFSGDIPLGYRGFTGNSVYQMINVNMCSASDLDYSGSVVIEDITGLDGKVFIVKYGETFYVMDLATLSSRQIMPGSGLTQYLKVDNVSIQAYENASLDEGISSGLREKVKGSRLFLFSKDNTYGFATMYLYKANGIYYTLFTVDNVVGNYLEGVNPIMLNSVGDKVNILYNKAIYSSNGITGSVISAYAAKNRFLNSYNFKGTTSEIVAVAPVMGKVFVNRDDYDVSEVTVIDGFTADYVSEVDDTLGFDLKGVLFIANVFTQFRGFGKDYDIIYKSGSYFSREKPIKDVVGVTYSVDSKSYISKDTLTDYSNKLMVGSYAFKFKGNGNITNVQDLFENSTVYNYILTGRVKKNSNEPLLMLSSGVVSYEGVVFDSVDMDYYIVCDVYRVNSNIHYVFRYFLYSYGVFIEQIANRFVVIK